MYEGSAAETIEAFGSWSWNQKYKTLRAYRVLWEGIIIRNVVKKEIKPAVSKLGSKDVIYIKHETSAKSYKCKIKLFILE